VVKRKVRLWLLSRRFSCPAKRGPSEIKRRDCGEAFIEEEDHKSHKKEKKIFEEKIYPLLFSSRIRRETAAIQIHSSYEYINGDSNHEDDQKERDQKRGAFSEYAQNQKKPCQKFNPRQGDGEDVYQKTGQNFVIVNNFGELFRVSDLIQAGINEGHTQYQSKDEDNPSIGYYGYQKFKNFHL
jgi:hypothetical protein